MYIGVYNHNGNPLAAPTFADVPLPAKIGHIQDKAQTKFPSKLKDVDVGDVKVYQLKREHESKLGARIELTEMATKLNFRSQIQNEACLAWFALHLLFL